MWNRRQAGLQGSTNGEGLQAHAKPASAGTRSGQPANQIKCARWCGVCMVWIYFIAGTVLPRLLHLPQIVVTIASILALLFATGISIISGGKWRWSWLIVLVAFACGISQSEQFASSALHWLGLALVIVAVGPVIQNRVATELRSAAWRLSVSGLTGLTAIFVIWYVLHLPSLGAIGSFGFSSFMNHCMLLGPIAGMGVVIAFARAMHGRSWRWGLLAALGIIPVLASSSRVATLATVAGVCFLLVRRKPLLGLGAVVICCIAIVAFVSRGRDMDSDSKSLTGGMAYKGNVNSRTELWGDRVLEFKSSPLVGIGIAMATGNGASVEENGNIRAEPGSSYLAVLAMTGAIGTIAFCWALGFLWFQFIVSRQIAGLEKDILSVVGIYLAVHGLAEGWILSFGSPLCFLFWLWLGNIGDAALQPVRAIAKRRLPAPQRFRSLQPGLRPSATDL